MAAHRLGLPTILLLAAGLGGCAALDPAAGVSSDPAMTASASALAAPADDSSDAAKGKQFFRDEAYGNAEASFRRAVEANANNAEAWLGLAATHDKLGRYDLADREYAQVEKKSGRSLALYNNRGYSYLLRGDFTRAKRDFASAERLAPNDEFVRNNLRLLAEKRAGRG